MKKTKETKTMMSKKGIKNAKRLIALCVAVLVVLTPNIGFGVLAAENPKENAYPAIQAANIQYHNGVTHVSGREEESSNLPKLQDAIMSILYASKNIQQYNEYHYGGNEFANEGDIYSKANIALQCGNIKLSNVMMAEGSIVINCTSINTDAITILYSKRGDIHINTGDACFKGIIYAPNGTITLNGQSVKVEGMLIAKNLITSTGKFTCTAIYTVNQLYQTFIQVRNDTILDTDIEIDNQVFQVEYESNKQMENIDIYVRYDEEEEFTFLKTLDTTHPEFTIDKDYTYMDIAFTGSTILGEMVKSNAHSFCINEGNIEYYSSDLDGDGIQDVEERWTTNTNPKSADTDGDGFTDYEECFELGTSPTEYTEDGDFDNDGVTNSEELKNKTNPHLADSDFDGITDKEDSNPMQYEGNQVILDEYKDWIGEYDKVTTIITEDDGLQKNICDPVNGKIKCAGKGDAVIHYVYDRDGKVTAEIAGNGDEYRINLYEYSKDGNIETLVNNNDIYQMEYDESGDMQSVSVNQATLIDYNEEENKLTYGNQDVISLDTEEGEAKKYCNDLCTAEYTLDEDNIVTSYFDTLSGTLYTYEYDKECRIKSVHTNNGFSAVYDYQENKTHITYSDGMHVWEQCIDNDSTTVNLLSQAVYTREEKNDNMYCQIQNKDKIIQNTKYVYNKENQIVRIQYQNGDILDYTYNTAGQITQIRQNGEITVIYDYMDNGQLFKECSKITGYTSEYYYDMYNNLLKTVQYSNKNNDNTKVGLQGKQEKIINIYSYESNLWNDVLTSYNGNYMQYDANGNPVTYYDGSSMQWQGTKLCGIEKDNQKITYTYNDDGMRIYKNVNGIQTHYLVEGKDIIAETTDGESIWYMYDNKSEILGFLYQDKAYYYEKNVQKDVLRIVDEEGDIVCGYTYDAWGNIVQTEGDKNIAQLNPIRYRSYYQDKETGYFYLQTRYYDSNTGRFINADDLARINVGDMDFNLYAYCGNDPIALYDPQGRAAVSVAMFSIKQFKSENNNVKTLIGKHFKETTFYQKVGDEYKDFTAWWNGLGTKRDLAIINSHANPDILSTKDKILLSKEQIKFLKKKNIKLLVVLGCNAGHFSHDKCIARYFANKVTGKVIASDGTVEAYGISLWPGYYGFVSTDKGDDNAFIDLCPNGDKRKNYGWLVYVGAGNGNGNSLVRIYYAVDSRGIKKLTVLAMCNLIDNGGAYLNRYK